MKITAIKQQAKRADRYSIFIDGKYSFSLSETALLESGINSGQNLEKGQVREFKQKSADDKIYQQALRYVSLRPRSVGEMELYLTYKKQASPSLSESILNKLSNIGLLNDEKLAGMFVNDRLLFRPTSLRKLSAELKKKKISQEIIDRVLAEHNDDSTLNLVIASKRRQKKYQDDEKLMQYLARQGYGYSDIKAALKAE